MPGQVRDLVVGFEGNMFNSTSNLHTLTANLQWVEPLEPQGNITSYEYSIFPAADPTASPVDGATSMTSAQSVVMATPFVQYNFSVLAVTGGGQGLSVVQSIFSPEAGKEY